MKTIKKILIPVVSAVLILVIAGGTLFALDYFRVINLWEKEDPRIIYDPSEFTYVTFGYYPQSEIPTEEAAPLFSLLTDETIWTSYEYYSEDVKSDFFLYTDVTYNGEKYRAVCFDKLRQNACQSLSDYNLGVTYWFKFEPITWRVLKEADGVMMLIAELALDSQPFSERFYARNGRYYGSADYTFACNNYDASYIRAWLNNTFYNTAFSEDEQSRIVRKKSDNVYLLSKSELEKEEYCFDINTSKRNPTDYAMNQGAIKNENGCFWWLCTSDKNTMTRADCVYTFGYVHTVTCVDASICVVPVVYVSK